MAKENLPTENRTVKESNACARSRMTGQTRNANVILKALIAQINTNDPDLSRQYSVNIAPYFNCENAKNINTKQIRDALGDLLGIKIFIETTKNNSYFIKGMVLIPEAEYEKGIITARFNHAIEKHLTQLKGSFTQFDAIEYSSLPSIYSQKLYEILKSYEHGLKHDFIEITIDELKNMLDCPKSMDDYKNFKRLVLNKSFDDINNKTSLKYEWEPIKKGRKVISIRFRIISKSDTKKKNMPLLALCYNNHEPVEKSPDEVKRKAQAIIASLRGGATGGLQPAGAILSNMMGKEGKP